MHKLPFLSALTTFFGSLKQLPFAAFRIASQHSQPPPVCGIQLNLHFHPAPRLFGRPAPSQITGFGWVNSLLSL
jgi:hypothetical protein